MYKPTRIARSPREHFMRAVKNEFSKFELKERALRQAERKERAAKLRLPIDLARDRSSIQSTERTYQMRKNPLPL